MFAFDINYWMMSACKDCDYTILKDIGLVIQYQTGDICPHKEKQFKHNIYLDKNYNKTFMFLVDIRTTNFISTEADIKMYTNFIIEMYKNYGPSRTAILTNTPLQVANATRITSVLIDKGMDYYIFSTLKSACNWLGISYRDTLIVAENLRSLKHKLSPTMSTV